jgi:hypothetical protein
LRRRSSNIAFLSHQVSRASRPLREEGLEREARHHSPQRRVKEPRIKQLPARRGGSERGQLRRELCAGQQARDLATAGELPGSQGREQQGSIRAQRRANRRFRAREQQQLHALLARVSGGAVQRRAAVAASRVLFGARLQQPRHATAAPVHGGEVQRSEALYVPCAHVGARSQQQPHALGAAALHRIVQRRPAAQIRRPDSVLPHLVEQRPQRRRVAAPRRLDGSIAGVHVGARRTTFRSARQSEG